MLVLEKITGFEWDEGNRHKSLKKHRVTPEEAEEAFFDRDKVIAEDVKHSESEARYILLGKTKTERLLYVVFTLRKKKIRVISARSINRREAGIYEKTA
jgi:uncharacterized DUF497 family protein